MAQNDYIDSLVNELRENPEEDTIRVSTLNDLIYEIHQINMDTALKLVSESEEIIEKLNYTRGSAQLFYYKTYIDFALADYPAVIDHGNQAALLYEAVGNKRGLSYTLNNIGTAYYYQGDLPNAILFYEKSIALDKELNDLKGVANGLHNIGTIYADQGFYDKALQNFNESFKFKENLNDSSGMATYYNNVGTIFSEQGDYPRGIESFNKCLEIRTKLDQKFDKITVLSNIAAIYKYQKNYAKSLHYYDLGLALSKELKDQKEIANYLNGIGGVHLKQSNYDSALQCFEEALIINKEINSRSEIARNLNNIASIELIFNEDISALEHFNQALEISQAIGAPLGQCRSLYGITKVYILRKEYQRALSFASKVENLAAKHQFLDYQRDIKESIATIHENLGNFQEAYLNYKEYKRLNDSLFNKENIEKITQLEYEYKYKQEIEEAKNREYILTKAVSLTSQDLEKSQRKYYIAVILVLLISIVSIGAIFFLKFLQVKAENKSIKIQQKLLRSQMTPHFIFNSLSILQGLILSKEEKKSNAYLTHFSKLLRMTLENSRHKIVSLDSELEALNSYMSLQNLDTDPPFDYSLSLDPKVKALNIQIPPMLIQPFVENAIEHAFNGQAKSKMIKVELSLKDGQLICTISDNGIGYNSSKKETKKNKRSLATTITSERLEILSEDFKMPSSISIENRASFGDDGTLVTLVIPYKIKET